MHRDLGVYLPAMEKQLAILDALYEEYNLESDEVVWNLNREMIQVQGRAEPDHRGRVVANRWRKVPDASSASCVQNCVSMSRVSVRCFQWLLISTTVEGLGFKKVLMSIFRSPEGAKQALTIKTLWFEKM